MATKTAPARSNPFGKPKSAEDGGFTFQVPANAKEGGNRGRIPKGQYIGRCTGIIFEKSKKSNNPMWTWIFTITKGKIGIGRDFKMWTVLTDDAAWKVVETLEALGIEVEPGEKIKLNKKDVLGVGCTMHIVDDDGQDGDEEWSKLKKISAHPEGAGFRPGGIAGKKVKQEEDEDDDRDYPRELDEGSEEEEGEGAEEEVEEKKPKRRAPVGRSRRRDEAEEEEPAEDEVPDEDVLDEDQAEEDDGSDDSDALLGEDDDEPEEVEEKVARRAPARTAPSKAPSKTARGKAPASLGKKRR